MCATSLCKHIFYSNFCVSFCVRGTQFEKIVLVFSFCWFKLCAEHNLKIVGLFVEHNLESRIELAQ